LGEKGEILAVGVADVIWSIWKMRNLACFEGEWPNEPCIVILKICYYIKCWSLLQVKEDVKDQLDFCAKLLEKVAKEVFGARKRCMPWIPRLAM
jgi:hypothetical protein